jgi:hypothetical protein
MKELKIKLVFMEQMLGTLPGNPELYETYIASKAPEAEQTAEEVAAFDVDGEIAKGKTVFARDADGNPCIYDYVIKGFFKDACSMLRRVNDTLSKKMTAHKKVIDGLIFAEPRMIKLELPSGSVIGTCDRPLRADTAQGPRVALSSSESAPAGTTCTFDVVLLDESLEPVVKEWLDYGRLRGIGGWRNSGTGRFRYEIIPAKA